MIVIMYYKTIKKRKLSIKIFTFNYTVYYRHTFIIQCLIDIGPSPSTVPITRRIIFFSSTFLLIFIETSSHQTEDNSTSSQGKVYAIILIDDITETGLHISFFRLLGSSVQMDEFCLQSMLRAYSEINLRASKPNRKVILQ